MTPTAAATSAPRLGSVFAKMLATCPNDVSAYGACLRQKVAEGQLEKGACEAQFAALARCFVRSRAKK